LSQRAGGSVRNLIGSIVAVALSSILASGAAFAGPGPTVTVYVGADIDGDGNSDKIVERSDGFAVGYLLDVFAAAPLGLYTFTCVTIFVVSRGAGVRLAAQTMLTKIALAFAFSLLEGLIIVILTAIFGGDAARPRALASLVLPHAISTALIAPLVFTIAERVDAATITVPKPAEVGR
jgi:hypothetical protein